MRGQKSWYGSVPVELLAIALAAVPVGLGVGYATGRHWPSVVTSLSITGTIFALLRLDLAFIHPLFKKLSPSRQVMMEAISGLLEHALGAWLAFSICNRLFSFFLAGDLAWYMAGGTMLSSMVVHGVSYTLYSHVEFKERNIREEQLRAMAAEAELKALKAQINPHFLFNTLNTIAQLIHTNSAQAEAMVERLAEMFRYVLAGSERGLVPLQEELAFVDGYLEIERARFGGRLNVAREVTPQALEAVVPSLILQPLVENAVRYGRGADGRIGLAIRAQPQGQEVVITVTDEGPGMPALDSIERLSGHGLRNVDERLRRTYGEGYGLEIKANEPHGTVVTIKVPKETSRKYESANC